MKEIAGRHISERMQQQAENYIRSTGDYRTPDELMKLLGRDAGWQKELQTWKERRQVFSIHLDGQELFPVYAFDSRSQCEPYPALATVLSILSGRVSALRIASWFVSINSFLDDRLPKDVLPVDASLVIDAAQDEMNEIEHGC